MPSAADTIPQPAIDGTHPLAPPPDLYPAQSAESLVGSMNSLRARLNELMRREQLQLATIKRLESQLREAGAMQRAFLPERIPDIKGIKVEVLYRPADHVSGDIYAVHRLDDTHVAFAVADATGHGLGAALLSALIHPSLRGSERAGSAARLFEPDEVLLRVNEDILGVGLADCQFVAALYAVYDEQTGIVRWARGGAPYPVLVREGQPVAALISEGPLVGTFESPHFEVAELRLEPGDRFMIFSDGAEAHIDLSEFHRIGRDGSEDSASHSERPDPLARLKTLMADSAYEFADDATALMLETDPSRPTTTTSSRPTTPRFAEVNTPSTAHAFSTADQAMSFPNAWVTAAT
jgi:serine phosphatase RsbU (regulator of sigma subunit)